jgi:glyoxylase-like metal-dependent hydrolase (beta-lactamase superfamily II)
VKNFTNKVKEILFEKNSRSIQLKFLTILLGIHCAIGYDLANSILIEGENGNILIDTLESRENAIELKKDFEILSSKSIIAIIYTHNHADHVNNPSVFADSNTKIYAHGKLLEIMEKRMSYVHNE